MTLGTTLRNIVEYLKTNLNARVTPAYDFRQYPKAFAIEPVEMQLESQSVSGSSRIYEGQLNLYYVAPESTPERALNAIFDAADTLANLISSDPTLGGNVKFAYIGVFGINYNEGWSKLVGIFELRFVV